MSVGENVLTPMGEAKPEGAHPYPPSWVNVATDWIERLPGPLWVTYVGLITLSVVGSQLLVWGVGIVPTGQIDPAQVYYGALLPTTLWLIHHLDGVARSALDAFRPALAVSQAELTRWRYELTVVPRRPATILVVLAVLFTVLSYAADPVATQVVGYSAPALVVRTIFESAIGWLIVVLVYHSIRQLRLVSRIHALATRVDLFQPVPLYAFSRLTSRTAIGLVLLQTPGVFFVPATQGALLIWAAWLIPLGIIAAAIFVLPLQGMHRRIAGEKERLESEVGRRIAATMADVHLAVDQRQRDDADALNKTLATLVLERDLVAKLPTWPWAAGTFWAFASAIVLPIALWFVTRLLERLV